MNTLERLRLEESDHVLIWRFATQQDAEAFSILMGRYADMVYTTCRRILGDETQTADAVQETFFQLVKDADRITGSLGSWLHRVATRRAVDVIRQNASRRRREASYACVAECRANSWAEVEPAVDEAVEELPEDLREVLLLHFLQGQTTTQIALAQGLSQATISRRVTEALELLRQSLRERGVYAGLAPLEAVLLHSNQIAPEALRYGLGKIALAKASLAGSVWAGSASVPAAAGGVKVAVAGAALVLAAGTTWVAHQEFSRSPASNAPPTVVAQSAPMSSGPGAAPGGSESGPTRGDLASDPTQARQQVGRGGSLSVQPARGLVSPSRPALIQRAPRPISPVATHTNTQFARSSKVGITNSERSGFPPLEPETVRVAMESTAPYLIPERDREEVDRLGQARVRPASRPVSPRRPGLEQEQESGDRRLALERPLLYGANTEAELYSGLGAYRPAPAIWATPPGGGAFNGRAASGPWPARSAGPSFVPPRSPSQAQTR